MQVRFDRMNRISDRLNVLSESETLAMARRSRELRNQGFDIVSLSLGEPDFDTPEFIKEAARKAIDENYTHYPPVAGYVDVREAIARKFKRDNNLNYQVDQIVVSTGAKQSIANAILSLINPGDEIILPAPYWVSYAEMIKLAGGIPVTVYAGIEQDYKTKPEQLKPYINDRTRLLVFSSPCNPTGSVFTKDELIAIADMLEKFPNILVISDEIYEHIHFSGQHTSMASIPGMYDRTITVNGLSKSFAMTGWRIGYIGAPGWIAKACDKFQGQITSGACTISQRAAIAALDADPATIQGMVKAFSERRALMLSLLNEIENLKVNEPQGAFYFFPDVSAYLGKKGIQDTLQLTMYLLNEYQLATVSGIAFGCNKSIRLSYAASEEQIREAIRRLKKGLESLNT